MPASDHVTSVATTTPYPAAASAAPTADFYVGLGLACSSSLFIGSSFVFKKKGLLKLTAATGKRAGDGGCGYLREPLWWAGVLLMTVGEGANFAAYAFAPASLVTPLGALSVLISAILSSHYLGEGLNLLGKLGCALSIIGSTVFVLHAPKEQEITKLRELAPKLIEPGFLVYISLVAVASAVLIFYCQRRWGHTNVLVYILTCSIIGSLSVTSCKGVGVGLKQTIGGDNQLGDWLLWVLVAAVAGCIFVQLLYLNRALDTFNTSVVTPIYYVLFTAFTVLASAILFKEWNGMAAVDVAGSVCGFLTVVAGIFLLHAFKDMNVSLRNLPSSRRPRSAAAAAAALPAETTPIVQGGAAVQFGTAANRSDDKDADDDEWASGSPRAPLLPKDDMQGALADKSRVIATVASWTT